MGGDEVVFQDGTAKLKRRSLTVWTGLAITQVLFVDNKCSVLGKNTKGLSVNRSRTTLFESCAPIGDK